MLSEAKWRFPRRKKQKKASAPRAQQLPALGAGINRSLVSLVDHVAGHAVDQLFLGLPRLMQHRAQRIYASCTEVRKSGFGQLNQLTCSIRLRNGGRSVGRLLPQ